MTQEEAKRAAVRGVRTSPEVLSAWMEEAANGDAEAQ